MKCRLLFLALFIFCYSAIAQNATVSGRVTDASGSLVSNAKVILASKKTGLRLETLSNSAGLFLCPPAVPGPYSLEVEAQGFSKWTLSDLNLEVGQSRNIQVDLQLASVQASLEVTDSAPLLQVASPDRSVAVESTLVKSVPLNVRNPYQLINFSPAVVQGSSGFGASGNNTASQTLINTFRINGGKGTTTEILLDGAANTTALSNQAGGVPQVDAIQEFRVTTTPYAPEYGRTSGGVVSFATRGGTNEYRGTAHEFLRNSVLDANGFNANRAGRPRQSLKRNQFGFTFGGPVWIPKLYKGANKTFFFVAYEGLRESTAGSFTGTVPTELERAGNFSQSRDVNGALLVMYDPATTRLDPNRPAGVTRYIRDPFENNIIPAGRLNAVGRNLVRFYPNPNQPGRGASTIDNFFTSSPSRSDQNRTDLRIDHNLTDKHTIMARYNYFINQNAVPNPYGNEAGVNATANKLPGTNVMGTHTWLLNATTIFQHHFSYAFSESQRTTPSLGYDPLQLGFASNTVTGLRAPAYPSVTANRLSGQGLGQISKSSNRPEVYQYRPTITLLLGRHTLKGGLDYRLLAANADFTVPLNVIASSNFTGGPNPQAAAAASGHGAADLLLGAATVSASITPFEQLKRPYYGFFFQDEFRWTNRVTLTLGLRYSFEKAFQEFENKYTYLDLASRSPLAARVPAFPNLSGGLGFVGAGGIGNRTQDTDWDHFDPRIGIAYQWNNKTVLRAGAGIFHHPAANSIDVANGFSARTTSTATQPDGVTPLFNLAQPFPNGPLQPTGASQGLNTLVGQNIASPLRNQQVSYSAHWSADLQRQLPGNFLLNLGYAANAGNQLFSSVNLNQLPDSALSQGANLLTTVSNPFFGVITDATSPLSRSTVQAGQLLRPYPQFLNVTGNGLAPGHSTYHSMQLSLERRFAQGLAVLFAYTKSKAIDNVGEVSQVAGDVAGFANNNCFACDRSLAQQHVPDVIRFSVRYDLPFGIGRPFWNKGFAARAFGGWAVASFWSWDNGFPIRVLSPNDTNSFGGGTNNRPNATGVPAKLDGAIVYQDNQPYFNTAAFTRAPAFTFGNVSRYLPDVRNPGISNFDLMLEKRFAFTERIGLDFRAEFFNAFNNVQFAGPGVNLVSADFGRIFLRQVNSPRQIQFGARLSF
jgi:hypothetical protein